MNWFRGYLNCTQTSVRVPWFFSPRPVLAPWILVFLSSVSSQTLLFSVAVNDICDSVCNAACLLCADGSKIFRCVSNMKDCKRLQSDIDCVRKWYLDNGMNFSVDSSTFINFTRRTKSIACKYELDLTHLSGFSRPLGIIFTIMLFTLWHKPLTCCVSFATSRLLLLPWTRSLPCIALLCILKSNLPLSPGIL